MKRSVLCLMLAMAPVWAGAQEPAAPFAIEEVRQLSETLKIGGILDVMRAEGIAHGAEMAGEMFPGQGGSGWQAMVATIYDPTVLQQRFDTGFAAALDGSDEVAAIGAFFGSELGQRVLTLEIEARRALLDKTVEEAAKLAWAGMEAEADPRVAALQAFVATNDLIESNVMGALNANLAFYQGMAEVGSFTDAMPEDQMLAEVWAQEPDMRAETMDWLFPYLALAYEPLSDADLKVYQDFSESPAGRAVNAALFSAFDALFVAVSRDLGRAAATQMQGQEL